MEVDGHPWDFRPPIIGQCFDTLLRLGWRKAPIGGCKCRCQTRMLSSGNRRNGQLKGVEIRFQLTAGCRRLRCAAFRHLHFHMDAMVRHLLKIRRTAARFGRAGHDGRCSASGRACTEQRDQYHNHHFMAHHRHAFPIPREPFFAFHTVFVKYIFGAGYIRHLAGNGLKICEWLVLNADKVGLGGPLNPHLPYFGARSTRMLRKPLTWFSL